VLSHADVLVIGHRLREVTDAPGHLKKPGMHLVDLVGLSQPRLSEGGYRGICW